MKIEIEINDSELRNAIYNNGASYLKSANVQAEIRKAAAEQIAIAIAGLDMAGMVRDEIDATVATIIKNGVAGRLRAIIRPLIQQECEKLRGEVAVAQAVEG